MKFSGLWAFFVSIVFVGSLSANQPLSGKFSLGSPRSVIGEIVEGMASNPSRMLFTSSSAERIEVKLDNYYYENGELSMSGKALASENSVLTLRGNDDYLEGWLVLRDRDLAYEYKTDAYGNVFVEQVPVTKIIPECNFPHSEPYEGWDAPLPPSQGPEPHIGDYEGQDVMKLQSLPGAEDVMFLDTRAIMNADGTPKNGLDREDMWQNWQGVASQLSMFEVNVTTDPEVYEATPVVNTAIAGYRDEDGRSHSGGSRWGSSTPSVIYRLRDGYEYGRIAGHEIGHTLSLAHDGGQPGGEYFEGFPDYAWTPLMGNVYPGNRWGQDALYHWSKGEYGTANNQEDDFEEILRFLDYREKDYPETRPLVVEGSVVDPLKNRGQILPNQDSDEFTFQIGAEGGSINFYIDRTEYLGGGMLDVHALILDSEGNTVEEDNVEGSRWAELNTDLPAGDYTLVIQGGAEGTPQTGFSNYSSAGFYAVEGEITGAVTPVAPGEFGKAIRASLVGSYLHLTIASGLELNSVSLFSTDGRRMYHQEKAVKNIDVSGFAPGIYLLKVVVDGRKLVRNFVKK